MKFLKSIQFLGLCGVMLTLQARGAFLSPDISPPSTSDPYGADFTVSGLTYQYTQSGGTGSLTIKDPVAPSASVVETYRTGSQAAGDPNLNPFKAFNGYFSLTATIQQVGGVWMVQSGSFTIEGDLQGGAKTDLLLAGSLATGSDGSAWGYDPNNNTSSHLEFLFHPTSGNSKILQDFFGTSGVGGMILSYSGSTAFNPSSSFWTATGQGDAFVPEASAYASSAGAMALLALLACCRRGSAPRAN